MAIIWAATNGHLDDVAPEKIGEFEAGFYRFLESSYEKLLPAIAKEKAISDELTAQLEEAVKAFKQQTGFGSPDDDEASPAKAEEAPKRGRQPADAERQGRGQGRSVQGRASEDRRAQTPEESRQGRAEG